MRDGRQQRQARHDTVPIDGISRIVDQQLIAIFTVTSTESFILMWLVTLRELHVLAALWVRTETNFERINE